MPRLEQLRDRLPSLYRPDEDDTQSLLARYLQAVAQVLETLNREAGEVLQAHWFEQADRALYSPYVIRERQLQGLPFPKPADPALAAFPFIHDLARLGSLLALPPWQEPAASRERVEEYRQRLRRVVSLYRQGLGTVGAVRRMVEAQLPPDRVALASPDRPFTVEEYAPLVGQALAVRLPGEPLDLVGPLMRWSMTNVGLDAATPTLYIEGATPEDGLIDPTVNPVVELYQAGSEQPRLGIAFRGAIAPGAVCRLRPAYTSWLGTGAGLLRAGARPGADVPADPTAPGPWEPVGAGGPTGVVVALAQVDDRGLWAAANADGAGTLWRYDGTAWATAIAAGLPPVRCLLADGQTLLVGADDGLRRVALYPPDGDPFAAVPIEGMADGPVQTMLRADDGRIWLGLADGARLLGPADTLEDAPLRGVSVFGIAQDRTGTLFFGTDLGLFQYQPGLGDWYWYAGERASDDQPDWQPFHPEQAGPAANLPTEDRVFLPPVRCVLRGPDASLWLGTERGIARYTARTPGTVGSLTYETVLEAFPEFGAGPIHALAEDARGLVWFATDRGLFRFDGRDWWQHRPEGWVDLGRASPPPDDPGVPRFAWRFRRASATWERVDLRVSTSDWKAAEAPVRSTAEPPVLALAWTDGVAGDLGRWEGSRFVSEAPIESASLLMRYKPDAQRIVLGGAPAVPRLPVGESVWRYLSLEPDDVDVGEERPAWTMEGRLVPPPTDLAGPPPGRFDQEQPPPASTFDEAVFPYPPAARVRFEWGPRQPLSVLVRLGRRAPEESIDPVILDRVWQGIQHVRPAGVRTMLAVDEEIVRGGDHVATG